MEKNQNEIAEFEYLGKRYLGKVYKMESMACYIFAGIFAAILTQCYEATFAYFKIKELEDVSTYSGSVVQRILYISAFAATAIIMYAIEYGICKLFKGDRKINIINGKNIIEDKFVPLTRKQLYFGKYISLIGVFIIATVILTITNCDFMLGAVLAVSYYYGIIGTQSFYMKRLKCEYYMPLRIGRGFVGVKECLKLQVPTYNKSLKSRSINDCYVYSSIER